MTGTPRPVGARRIPLGVWLGGAAAVANSAYLHWIWRHGTNWGIWDWDLSAGLAEAARRSLLDFGQLPLWNPWLGGGGTLVGHPLASTFAPSFLPVLLFGTVAGLKLCIWLYLGVAQCGAYLLARRRGLDRLPAVLAALVFSWGGVFAQHLAHGHIGWIGYAWLPFVMVALHDTVRGAGLRPLAAGGVFVALSWLDGGVYHYVFTPFFVGMYALVLAVEARSQRPLWALPAIAGIAVALAAIELVPVLESIFEHPRPTPPENNFYGAPFQPTAGRLLVDAFLARAQSHRPEAWMPYVLNVGAYVGVLPLVLAALGLALRPRRAVGLAAIFTVTLLICLSGTLPLDPWAWLHRLPGFDSMQIPMRFNIAPLLCLALLAATGLQGVMSLERLDRAGPALAVGLVVLVGLDLFVVNAPVFRVAYAVPPIAVEARDGFVHYRRSPYRRVYRRTALYPLWPNWPTATFPLVLENAGVVEEGSTIAWPRKALPHGQSGYPGAEVFSPDPGVQVAGHAFTPNRIRWTVRGRGGRVVINQNDWRGWRVVEGEARRAAPFDGLLAFEVPPGEHEVVVAFRPGGFAIGAGLSLAAAVALAFVRFGRRGG